MGNTIPQASASPLDLRTFLVSSSLPKSLIVTSKLSDRKFIKTLRCKFEDEDVVLKVHFREKATERSNEILRHMTMLEKRFRASHCVLPYRYASPSLWFFFFNKNKILSQKRTNRIVGKSTTDLPFPTQYYLVRQYLDQNLKDALKTRPFFEMEEKRWIVYQLLKALEEMRRHRTTHGDLKAENVLLTSWNWIVITDLAPFKPTRLPEENPAVYNYYFASGPNRQACLVAPERFFKSEGRRYTNNTTGLLSDLMSSKVDTDEMIPEHNSSSHILIPRKDTVSDDPREDSNLQHSMDIFSCGCLITEMFKEGPLFTLATLQDYASGKFDLKSVLKKSFVDEQHECDFLDEMREMVEHMLCLDSSLRDDAANYTRRSVFPSYYPYLYTLFTKIFRELPEKRVYLLCCEYVVFEREAREFSSYPSKNYSFVSLHT